jgi:hypothetical protein
LSIKSLTIAGCERAEKLFEFANYVCNGIRDGFDTMITNADLLTFECRNNFSARSQPAIVKDLIDKECEKGFLSGYQAV